MMRNVRNDRRFRPQARIRSLALAAGLTLGLGLAPAAALGQSYDLFDPDESAWAESFAGVLTFTKPSGDAIMGFSVPTTVTEVLVEGGQVVREGDLLIRGEDTEQLAIVHQTKLRAESGLALQRAQKQAELAKVEYDRSRDAFQQGGVNQIEVDRARLTWETAEIDVRTAELNEDLEQTRLEQAEALLAKYRLAAPFAGAVDEVFRDVGTSMDNAQPVVRVVRIDPLWIDVPAPTETTIELGLKRGDDAWILLDTPGEPILARGEIVEVSPVADYASRSRRVRVELPNDELLPPGLRCWVRFTAPQGEWAAEPESPEAESSETESSETVSLRSEAGTP